MCVISSAATYTEKVRQSPYYVAIMVAFSIVSAWLWVLLVRRQSNNSNIAMWSFTWDLIIVLSYSVIPMVINHKNLSWQVYAAIAMCVAGLLWLKTTLGE